MIGKAGLSSRVAQPATIYHYRQIQKPGSGAAAFAFQRHWTDPVQNIFGPTILTGGMRIFSAPMVVSPASWQTGLGGIVAGQMMLAPLLVDPSTGF